MTNFINNNGKREKGIEELLGSRISLDTPVRDFLLIAAWDYYGFRDNSHYESADSESQEKIRRHIKSRREKLSVSEMNREKRFCDVTRFSPLYQSKNIITLRDLKEVLEKEGVRLGSGVRYKTIAHLNETLSEYGLEPFKIGGRSPSAEVLKKHGLKRTET